MYLKLLIATSLALSGIAAGQANAMTCSLTASTNYVAKEQTYGYAVRTGYTVFLGEPPTYTPITVVFRGTKNGVPDIGPAGEPYGPFRGNVRISLKWLSKRHGR